jgi:hypothetical protein
MRTLSTRGRLSLLMSVGVGVFAPRFSGSLLPATAGRTTREKIDRGNGKGRPAVDVDRLSAFDVVDIVATDYDYDMPDELTAGWNRLVLTNTGDQPHHAQFLRLLDGVTFDDFGAAMQTEGFGALALVTLDGGPGIIEPGARSEVLVDLAAGAYAVGCFNVTPEGLPHVTVGMIKPVTVAESTTARVSPDLPPADLSIRMLDFAFVMPRSLPAGQTVIEITNDGPEPHEWIVLRLAEGVTPQMLIQHISEVPGPNSATDAHSGGTPATGDGPPADAPLPYTLFGGLQAISGGQSGLVVLDLVPGTYVAICNVPSPANEFAPHFALGMVAQFTVE